MVILTCGAWQSRQLLENTTAFHCQHYAQRIKSSYFTIYSTAMSWSDDELPYLPSKLLLLSGNVGNHLHLSDLSHTASPLQDVACTAGAPVCFSVSSYRAEPTNCERKLSAPVVVMVELDEWKRRLFLLNSLAEKAKQAPSMQATVLCCLAAFLKHINNKENMSCVISFVQQQLCIYMKKKTVVLL